MVSVELMMREVRSPVRLSGPYSLKISRTSPVAAEEENILMSKRGMIGAGISAPENSRLHRLPTKSRKPEARRTPTAIISPIIVGAIEITVCIFYYIKNEKCDDDIGEIRKNVHGSDPFRFIYLCMKSRRQIFTKMTAMYCMIGISGYI